MTRLVALALCVLAVGCPEPAPPLPRLASLAECQAAAAKGKADAQAARDAHDPKAAQAAARIAEDAAEQAATMTGASAESAIPWPPSTMTRADISTDARAARRLALLAAEDARLAKKLGGLTATAYGKGSALALTALFKGLSLAAGQADGRDLEALPEPARGSALLAADLAGELAGREKLPNGDPDWAGISSDLEALGKTPNARTHLFLAVALLALARDGLALVEVAAVDPAGLGSDG